ncbi:MAG: dodecin domain-containing protein [Candidatus Lokiarchaeota archaeon]|nr:dodecin domain-containing protein [Candidatus Lokiarchaeota archaeon]
MSHLYKSIELVGTSDIDWSDAVKNAYKEAKKSIRGIRNIEIIKSDVKVKEDLDKLIFRVRVRLNFEIEM